MEAIRAAPMVFADANLPAATLAAVAKAAGPRLVIDAISRAKAVRILPAVGQGALVFVNRAAAAALLGREPSSPTDAARSLGAAGFTRVVVTGGPRPLAILDHGAVRTIDVPPVDVVDVTGAGDALTAGTIVGLDRGLDLSAAVAIGIAAAGAALRSTGALDRLPPDVLQRLPAPPPSIGAQP
jgi:sugar/nucleoside kinase (ribokinase family)